MKAKCVGGVLNGKEVEISGERIKAVRQMPLPKADEVCAVMDVATVTVEYDWYDLEHIGPNDWRYRLSS